MIPESLIETRELVFDKCGFEFKNLEIEKESAEYALTLIDLKYTFVLPKLSPLPEVFPLKAAQMSLTLRNFYK